MLVKHRLKVPEDKVYCSLTEISPFNEARIDMYCLTLALENERGSNFRKVVLVFANEMKSSETM